MTEGVPVYLGRERAKERKMMARFRCGNEEREEKERAARNTSEDGREIGWMKETWKRRERIEKQMGGE
jgi:hypothetical protein